MKGLAAHGRLSVSGIAAFEELPRAFVRSCGLHNVWNGVAVQYRRANGATYGLASRIIRYDPEFPGHWRYDWNPPRHGERVIPIYGERIPYGLWRLLRGTTLVISDCETPCLPIWYENERDAIACADGAADSRLDLVGFESYESIFIAPPSGGFGETFGSEVADRVRALGFKGTITDLAEVNTDHVA